MYLLDSNICIFMIRDKTHYLREKIKQFSPSLLHLSVVTVAELEYGAAKSQNHLREHMAVLDFVSPFDILNFTPKDAENFGLIRAYLEKKGIRNIILVGYDIYDRNIEYLKRNIIHFLIAQQPREQGRKALRMISECLNGSKRPLLTEYQKVEIVNSESLRFFFNN